MLRKFTSKKNKEPDWYVGRKKVWLIDTERSTKREINNLDDVLLIPDISDISLSRRQKRGLNKGALSKGWRSMSARDALQIWLKAAEMAPRASDKSRPPIKVSVNDEHDHLIQRLLRGETYESDISFIWNILLGVGGAIQLSLDMMEEFQASGREEDMRRYEDIKQTLFETLPRFFLRPTNGSGGESEHYVYKGFFYSPYVRLEGDSLYELRKTLQERPLPTS